MKRLTSLLLSLLLLFGLTGCGNAGVIGGADGPTNIIVSDSSTPDQSQIPPERSSDSSAAVLPEGSPSGSEADTGFVPVQGEYYYDLESVVLYLECYGMLPDNYITKKEAQALGWDSKEGNLGAVAPGKSIGGDYFGNYEGRLPEADGREYHECDIDSTGSYRGAKRLVYSNDGLIYYTEDHYETFELMYGEESP